MRFIGSPCKFAAATTGRLPLLSLLLLLLYSAIVQTVQASSADTTSTSSSVTKGAIKHSTTPNPPSSISPSSSLSSSSLANATCEFRTINYITHQLPQQCLRTAWASENATTATTDAVGEQVTGSDAPGNLTAGNTATDTIATSLQNGTAAATSTSNSTVQHTGSSTSAVPSRTTTATGESEVNKDDTESELNDASFLSFEEWKKQQMLEKNEQPPQGHGARRSSTVPDNGEERDKTGPYQAMESPTQGINLNLEPGTPGAEGKPAVDGSGQPEGGIPTTDISQEPAVEKKVSMRSKDAGKTCKERFNYASFDAGATVVKTNPEAKNAKALLVENKDSYMLTPCSANNKQIIVELSEEIFIDTVVLANFEFFSSVFRQFSVYASDRYPPKGDRWTHLGTYEARNSREIQAFLVEEPIIWARYVKVEFLNHWGHEFYCPVSILRVHGKSQLEDYRLQEEAASGALDSEEEEPLVTDTIEAPETTAPSEGEHVSPDKTTEATPEPSANASIPLNRELVSPWVPLESARKLFTTNDSFEVCFRTEKKIPAASLNETIRIPTDLPSSTFLNASNTISDSLEPANTSSNLNISSSTNSSSTVSSSSSSSSVTASGTQKSAPITGKASDSTPGSTKSTSTSASASPSPSSQESFFKTVSRRLQLLESNSTLSLKYIEDQSKILRDAFAKVEKKQLAKTNTFLEHLNETVLEELRVFRQQYDQIWQSTIIELETQRDRSEREMLAVSTRLNVLADEVVFQKRMSIVQSVLLLLCLGLIIFSRGSNGGYIDLSLLQNMRAKSPTIRGFVDDSSPTFEKRPWHGNGHMRHGSDESVDSVGITPIEDSRGRRFSISSDEEDATEIRGDSGVRIHITDDSETDLSTTRSKISKSDTSWQEGNTIPEEPSLPSTPASINTLEMSPPLLRTQSSPSRVSQTQGSSPERKGSPSPNGLDDNGPYDQHPDRQPFPSPPPEDHLGSQLLSPSRKPLPALPRSDTA